jgi:hypothetical protein
MKDTQIQSIKFAIESLKEIDLWTPDGTKRSPKDRGAVCETVYELASMRAKAAAGLEAILEQQRGAAVIGLSSEAST